MFPIEKLFRDIRLLKIYEGTSEIQRMIVSGHVLGAYQPIMPPLEDLPIQREIDPLTPPDAATAEDRLWRCRMCGYVHPGPKPPSECPFCFVAETAFKPLGNEAA